MEVQLSKDTPTAIKRSMQNTHYIYMHTLYSISNKYFEQFVVMYSTIAYTPLHSKRMLITTKCIVADNDPMHQLQL